MININLLPEAISNLIEFILLNKNKCSNITSNPKHLLIVLIK